MIPASVLLFLPFHSLNHPSVIRGQSLTDESSLADCNELLNHHSSLWTIISNTVLSAYHWADSRITYSTPSLHYPIHSAPM